MARGKSHRRSQAAKKRMEDRRSLTIEPQQPTTSSRARRGTGYRHAVQKWPTSSLTGRSHKLVIPAESPHKKFVLLIGDSHLRSFADGFVEMPEGGLLFGVQSTPGATAAELATEVVHAALPRAPDAVCLLAPSNNLTSSRTIEHASADFGKLLAIVCTNYNNVVVVDFPPRLNIDVQLQQLFREEYHRVAARMGVKYFSAVDYFPTGNLDLWSRDGVHLSDTGGMPILAQLLWHASYMALQPEAPKPHAPPRSRQPRSTLPKVVVRGPITQPRLPANPFEWTVVSRGREHQSSGQHESGHVDQASVAGQQVVQEEFSIPAAPSRYSVLLDVVEEIPSSLPACLPACLPARTAVPNRRKEPRVVKRVQRAASSSISVAQPQTEAATGVRMSSRRSSRSAAKGSATQEVEEVVQVCSRASPSSSANLSVSVTQEVEEVVQVCSRASPSSPARVSVTQEVDAAAVVVAPSSVPVPARAELGATVTSEEDVEATVVDKYIKGVLIHCEDLLSEVTRRKTSCGCEERN